MFFRHWCIEYEEQLSEIIANILISKYPQTSPTKRKRTLKSSNQSNGAPTAEQVRRMNLPFNRPCLSFEKLSAVKSSWASSEILSLRAERWNSFVSSWEDAASSSASIQSQQRGTKGEKLVLAITQRTHWPMITIFFFKKQFSELFSLAVEDETTVSRRGTSSRGGRKTATKKETNSNSNSNKKSSEANNKYSSEESSDVSLAFVRDGNWTLPTF